MDLLWLENREGRGGGGGDKNLEGNLELWGPRILFGFNNNNKSDSHARTSLLQRFGDCQKPSGGKALLLRKPLSFFNYQTPQPHSHQIITFIFNTHTHTHTVN